MGNETTKTPEERELVLSRTERSLLGQIETAKDELDAVLHAINSAKGEVQELNAQKTALENKIAGLDKLLNDYSIRKNDLEKRLDEQNETLKTTSGLIKQKNERIQAIQVSLDTLESELAESISGAREREAEAIKDLTKQKEVLNAELKVLNSDIEAGNLVITNLNVVIKDLKEEKSALSNDITALTAERNELSRQCEVLAGTLKTEQGKVESLKTIIATLTTKQTSVEAEIARLEGLMPPLQEQIAKLQNEIVQMTGEYESAKGRLFNIARREEHVNNQEEYIIEQFKLAGVPYTPFSE